MRRIRNERVNQLVELHIFFDDLLHIETIGIVHPAKHRILFLDRAFEFAAQRIPIQQIDHADTCPGKLIDIGRPDAATRRTNGAPVAHPFARFLNTLVIRHDQMRIV